jgi:hypothetical protein
MAAGAQSDNYNSLPKLVRVKYFLWLEVSINTQNTRVHSAPISLLITQLILAIFQVLIAASCCHSYSHQNILHEKDFSAH